MALAVRRQVERGVLGEGAARVDVRQRQQAGEVARVQRASLRGVGRAGNGAIAGQDAQRSEERRVGKDWVSTGRSRWSQLRHKNNITNKQCAKHNSTLRT